MQQCCKLCHLTQRHLFRCTSQNVEHCHYVILNTLSICMLSIMFTVPVVQPVKLVDCLVRGLGMKPSTRLLFPGEKESRKRDLRIILAAKILVGVALRSDLSNTLHANKEIQPGLETLSRHQQNSETRYKLPTKRTFVLQNL